MFQKSKTVRSRIVDLPESLSDLSAKELDKVSGGMRLAVYRGAGSLGGRSLHGGSTKPASMTNPGQIDTATD